MNLQDKHLFAQCLEGLPSDIVGFLPPVRIISDKNWAYPVLVYSPEKFALLSVAVGGLVHFWDAAHCLSRTTARVHQLANSGRFTRFRFPFGDFLSVVEVAQFVPRREGRPSKISAVEKNPGKAYRTNPDGFTSGLKDGLRYQGAAEGDSRIESPSKLSSLVSAPSMNSKNQPIIKNKGK